ncbi:short chain dehydrogenase [Hypoxylon sp. FL1284]|nr:short chain dehydrogenase [Hypoxylon sp. FL1284]
MDVSGLFRVDGMVAVITGGGTGIGFAMAKGLAGAGAKKVYILGRRQDVLETAAKAHPSLAAVQCDVTDKASLQSAVDLITKEVGYVNLLVANSGIVGPPQGWKSKSSIKDLRKHMFEDVSMEDFTNAFRVNVTGTFFTLLAFLELLDEGNKQAVSGGFGAPTTQGAAVPSIQSQVVITASLTGLSRQQFITPAYTGSKASLIHLTKHTSSCLAEYGIRVNALAPGLFPSELSTTLMAGRDPSTETPENPLFIPAKKFGGDDEMAGSILFLASKAGSFCNGFILVNDGGRLAVTPATY